MTFPKLNLKTIIFLLVIVGAGSSSYYFYTQYVKAKALLENPTEAAKAETQAITSKLGTLIELPNEEPTVATILDKDKLKDQPFFARAENGDKVLIYPKALKAILYRPGTNRVVDFGTINIESSSAQAQRVRLAIYNGTETAGLAQVFEKDVVKGRTTNVDVVARETAKKTDYDTTIVVDLAGDKADVAQQLAQLIGGTVGELPDEEQKPKLPEGQAPADLLVIIGKNYTPSPVSPSPSPAPSPSPSPSPSPAGAG